jgi:hypothetical protein
MKDHVCIISDYEKAVEYFELLLEIECTKHRLRSYQAAFAQGRIGTICAFLRGSEQVMKEYQLSVSSILRSCK